uniref:Glycogen operon protein n=1 Tax=Candidatus Kentrum sp. FM TaxID=2126340 RepID=A0A450TJG5_9GAMM|nr:MAG: glycogen operon protein [Candidatus Kentron sp. FM]VFJ67516.1 MAG: glycogen operon protein [Candidatus Kentron sp. FM]VFK16626.1 MAG: glycogen operon protein [Candidatus Kentron sp. FM]
MIINQKLTKYLAPLSAILASQLAIAPAMAGIDVQESLDTSETRHGAHIGQDGWVHFVVFSPNAAGVDLQLYDTPDAKAPAKTIPMKKNGDDWRIRIRGDGIGAGLHYTYRARGERNVSLDDRYGLMFNENYPLGDPYAYRTQDVTYSKVFSSPPRVHADQPGYVGGGKSIVYDHGKDTIEPGHVSVKREDLIVYEMHVQDFTARMQSLDSSLRGTYLGLATPGLKTPGGLSAGIDHLVDLGVTAVELMPVMEYDQETGNVDGRLNHWGYMTTNFFAPEARYASQSGNAVYELKQLVKAFHDRGIAVIMDTVYNHTGEQSPYETDNGKMAAKYYNLLGLANQRTYRSTDDGRYYFNNTGTGNDVNFRGGERYTKRLTLDSLNMWHNVYGIDGFRFDLARILADGSDNAADWVDNDERFQGAHLHAEPWDMGGVWFDFMDSGGYSHENNRWAKWGGQYRDHIRNFSKSTLKNRTLFKRLIEGYGDNGAGGPASGKPWRSVNLVCVHDGYTMRDAVYFNDDDGSHNAWDSGGNENLRRERQKLLMGVLLTSQGVPLILQGDEFGRTKAGAKSQAEAHNTYNYESTAGDAAINNVNWIDWRLKDGDNSESPQGPTYGKELFYWTKNLIALRKHWSHFRRADFAGYAPDARNGGADAGGRNDGRLTYSFDGPDDGEPTQLAAIWWGKPGEPDLMVIYNEDDKPFTVGNLADWSQGDWRILARSWYGDDADFCGVNSWQSDCPSAKGAVEIKGRSIAILISDND